jgi:uncharacterized membrane protein YoaK (UPF0700 family)
MSAQSQGSSAPHLPAAHVPAARAQMLPFLLSFVAGYVDSCTFLALFGLFVAQLTGSFVTAGAGLVVHEQGFLIKVLGIPVFMLAAGATTILVATARDAGRSAWVWGLGLEAALLTGFLVVAFAAGPFVGSDQPAGLFAGLCGLFAMGVQSALVRLLRHGAPSTNVMTTNTTQIAIDATELLMTRFRSPAAKAATPRTEIEKAQQRCLELIPVMLGFFVGTMCGALAFAWIGIVCLVLAIGILLSLMVGAHHLGLA